MFAAPAYQVPLWKQITDGLFTYFRLDQSGGLSMMLNPVLWTMPIELQGSLVLFAVYCYGADLFRHWGGAMLVMLLAAPLTFGTKFYGFGLGIAIFEAKRLLGQASGKWRSALRRAAFPVGLALLLAGLWLGSTPFVGKGETSYRIFIVFIYTHSGLLENAIQLHHLGAACLIASILLLAPVQRLLTTSVCQYLGKISFMLYLLQVPALGAVAVPVFLHMPQHWAYQQKASAAFVAYLAAAFVLAEIATRLIDKPFIRLSRRATARNWGWRSVAAWVCLAFRSPKAGV